MTVSERRQWNEMIDSISSEEWCAWDDTDLAILNAMKEDYEEEDM